MTREEIDALLRDMKSPINKLVERYKKATGKNPGETRCARKADSRDGYISKTLLLDEIDNERDRLVSLNMLGAEHVLTHHGRRLVEEAPAERVIRIPDGFVYFTSFDGENYLVSMTIPISKEQFDALGSGTEIWEVIN